MSGTRGVAGDRTNQAIRGATATAAVAEVVEEVAVVVVVVVVVAVVHEERMARTTLASSMTPIATVGVETSLTSLMARA